ncbi:MAG: hypothetical protein RLZZ234_379 [Candidatus Parcubacteria bacterium]
MKTPRRLSVVVPCYNEAQTIEPLLDALLSWHHDEVCIDAVIVVNDGSTDGTADVVADYVKKNDRVVTVMLPVNRGKGAAVRRGVMVSRSPYTLFMDADGAVPVCEMVNLMRAAVDDATIVIASLRVQGARNCSYEHPVRRVARIIGGFAVRMTVLPGIYDTQRGYKLFPTALAHVIANESRIDGWMFDVEWLMAARARHVSIREVPVCWENGRVSRVGVGSYLEALRDLLLLWMR